MSITEVADRELDTLRAAYLAWSFERSLSGIIVCTLGGYHLLATDIHEARHGIIARLREVCADAAL